MRACGHALLSVDQVLELPFPINLFNEIRRLPPIGLDFDEEFEKDPGSSHSFDLQTGRCSDLLQHRSLLSDKNGFLSFALAVNCCRDASKTGTFLEFVN